MDQSWMHADRLSDEYFDGMNEFVRFMVEHGNGDKLFPCPCWRCRNKMLVTEEELKDHLMIHGIHTRYACWTKHGQAHGQSNFDSLDPSLRSNKTIGIDESDHVKQILNVLEEDLRDCPDMFKRLKNDAEVPLYDGCTKYTRLEAVLKLYNLKASNGWSDKSFTDLLLLLNDMLSEDNMLPTKTYDAKQVISSIGLTHERIHACPNDCVLFRNEYESLKECPMCHASRYKKNESTPAKVVWYFPIIPRFRRLYRSAETAKLLRWHADERIRDGKLRHPADSPQWKKFDAQYVEFAEEIRNLRLVLATDGMNPHSMQSSTHSTWPVILMIYNLPPSICMKRKYMMLSMLISGPKQPGNDIDVYLAPLIEDLKLLWETGVEIYDGFKEETFTLKAMLYGTINDFPAYGNLSGWSVKGQCACPVCGEDTDHIRLETCKKNVFMGHRRWLRQSHRFRKMKIAFNGKIETRRSPRRLTGNEVLDQVKNIRTKFGKSFAKEVPTSGWKKLSIFFELPYWESLNVRHFLDVMHVEKNVCESLLGTLLNIPGKKKDGFNARLDLQKLGIRAELQPVQDGRRTILPPAAYTLSKKEKHTFCECLSSVKVPEGYSSNIRSLVSVKELKLKGLKSHDCHVLIENFIPIAIRSILPKKVRVSITKFCFFFKAICSKVLDPERLSYLQKEIVKTLCELEMYFLPSFFDVMIHLTIHLVEETKMCGPAYMRWMYPIERYMKVLKGYVKNRSRPEGCIAERYLVEEAIEFCNEYLQNVEPVGISKSRHSGRMEGEGTSGGKLSLMLEEELKQAHLYVIHNSVDIELYVDMHKDKLRSEHPNRGEGWITKEHNNNFADWLREHISQQLIENKDSISDRIKWLANGPRMHAYVYHSYLINGYTFYTKSHDEQSTMQNSGVTLVAQSLHVSSAKDTNPIYANMSYFGIIQEIWELIYTGLRVPIFKCKWVNNNHGVQIDELGFIRVSFNKEGYKDEPFILASQAQQVFYVSDPVDKTWSIVLLSNKPFILPSESTDENFEETNELDDPFYGIEQSSSSDESEDADESYYVRTDHQEGLVILNPSHQRIKGHRNAQNLTKKRKRVS